ncbi:MAG: DUF4097 family beta strand repeat-containing protein, partial [Planctomycetaceae bacterium]
TETTKTISHPITPEITELRLAGQYAEVQITGEDRADIETTLRVLSNAADDAEARRTAEATVLLVDRAGATISFRSDYPVEGRQRAFLMIKVPARLRLRLEHEAPQVAVANVSAVDVPAGRLQMSFKDIAGRLTVSHRGGEIEIENVGSLKFSGRGTEARIARVRGEVAITMQSGELDATELGGPVDIETSDADIAIRQAEHTRGPIRINATSGNLVIDGLQTETRIDGRNADIAVSMTAPAPITIYNQGDERIALTPPPGGYTVDALAADGRITIADDLRGAFTVEPKGDLDGERASGTAGGGGPTITLRANHGNIAIRSRGDVKSTQ